MSEQAAQPRANEAPAADIFFQLATGHWVSKAIYVAARLRLADLLAGGPQTVEELAAGAGADAPTLYRLMRALAGVGIFKQEADARFHLTPLAELLRSGPGTLRGMALHLGESASWMAWDGLLESVRTGESAFKVVHGVEVFPYYAAHPESDEPFNEAMVGASGVLAEAVTKAYDFTPFEKIVDVGGGHGRLLTAILHATPRARGVIFDQPQVAAGARASVEAAGLAGRCETAGGDFFESVPEGGDAYILKWILHDWDDARALSILRNCQRAMREGGRLLLVEGVVPEDNEPAMAKMMDLQMLVMTGGRERTAREFRALLAEAGLEMTRVVATNSPVSVVEAVRVGERS